MRLTRLLPPRTGGDFEADLAALARKYPNVRADVDRELKVLLGPPPTPIPSGQRVVRLSGLGGRVALKIRISSSDQGRGASGGFRLILAEREPDSWRPVAIYAKSQQEDISPRQVLRRLDLELGDPPPPEPVPPAPEASKPPDAGNPPQGSS